MGKTVLIIGAGLAGLVAAHHARKHGAEVLVLARGAIGLGSNSAMANGVFAGPTRQYAAEEYIAHTKAIGKELNRGFMVDLVAQQAQDAFAELEPLGLSLREWPTYYTCRSRRSGTIRGAEMMAGLAQALAGAPRIRRISGFRVDEIAQREGRFVGVRGWDREGLPRFIPGDAGILAAGGGGALYQVNDNQKSTLGQGYHIAAKANLALHDMEFVQFYPLVLNHPGLPGMLVYPPTPPEARLLNQAGEDLLAKLGIGDLEEAVVKMRDLFSHHLYLESQSSPLYLDFSRVPAEKWEVYPMTVLAKLKHDFRRDPVRVSPGAHFFMGGVAVDRQGCTEMPGLWACGEVVWGLHGANRRGGNALTECVVFGRLAGKEAARAALEAGPRPDAPPTGSLPLDPAAPQPPLRGLLQRLRHIAWTRAGIVRGEAGLRAGLEEAERLQAELMPIVAPTLREWNRLQDLEAGVFTLKAILLASLARGESRGSFIRSDFPQKGGEVWRKNSRLQFVDRGIQLSHIPAG